MFYRVIVSFILLTLPAAAPAQGYQKITIKSTSSNDPRNERIRVLPNGDLRAHSVNAISLLSYAYGVPSNPSPRLNALPDWTIADRYDIVANTPTNTIAPTAPDTETQAQLQQRIRTLLAARFSLVMRVQQPRMAAYALTVSASGPKLQKSAVTNKDCIYDTASEGCHNFVIGFGHPLDANAINMEDLAHYIENWTDLPVVDHTNLTGLFTTHTEGWLPMRLPPPPPNGNGNVNFTTLPTLFAVLGKLGLELHRQQETLPVYTIERIKKPTFN